MQSILKTIGVLSVLIPGAALALDTCTVDGPIEVCRTQDLRGDLGLTIRYRGGLLGSEDLKAWVRLNGREGRFALEPVLEGYPRRLVSAQVFLAGEGCERRSWWVCAPDLFFYAQNENGDPNAWDVEIAVSNSAGEWDSRFGANYRFRF